MGIVSADKLRVVADAAVAGIAAAKGSGDGAGVVPLLATENLSWPHLNVFLRHRFGGRGITLFMSWASLGAATSTPPTCFGRSRRLIGDNASRTGGSAIGSGFRAAVTGCGSSPKRTAKPFTTLSGMGISSHE